MICKTCGTQIADKALICFRCGHSTFEPARRQQPAKRRSLIPTLIALVILVVGGVLMPRVAPGTVPQAASVVLLVLAVIVLAWRVFERRRR
jgi:hypothetical protein